MSTAMSSDLTPGNRSLADPALRRAIEEFVRRRVPSSDVDDVVQTVLVEALASPSRPHDETELRKWLLGIARHKVVDHHRRASRETAAELPDLPVGPAPIEAKSLAQWAERQAGTSGDAQSTLAWMAREGEGEKLEAIAAEEKVPAARVRQRVSRMRRWMKERWLAELAAAAALVILGVALWRLLRKEDPIAEPTPEPKPSSTTDQPVIERARALRELAFELCDRSAWRACLDRLDEAKALDPAGDAEPRVGAARARASDALNQKSPPKSTEDAPPKSTDEKPPTKEPIQRKSTVPAPKNEAPAPTTTSAPTSKPAPDIEDPFGKSSPRKAPSKTKFMKK